MVELKRASLQRPRLTATDSRRLMATKATNGNPQSIQEMLDFPCHRLVVSQCVKRYPLQRIEILLHPLNDRLQCRRNFVVACLNQLENLLESLNFAAISIRESRFNLWPVV